MARPDELVPGNCYFSVDYCDNELLFPHVTTLRYLRRDDRNGEDPVWLFEYLSFESEADVEEEETPPLLAFPEDQLYTVVEFPRLIAELAAVGLDHPLEAPDAPRPAELPVCTDFADLDAQVTRFIEDPECAGLTITIRYTDDGLSLSRDTGGFGMHLYPDPRTEPEREGKIRRLFAGLGVSPHEDYLANRGRTRILAFAIPEAHDAIVSLCRRILTDVYGMRAGDALKYSSLARADVGKRFDH
jgi:hypothetical protein